jgi:hypothetical protein
MVGLRHDISYLRPPHPIFQRHLVRGLAHDRCFDLLSSHITEYRTSHCISVLSLPPSTPHDQTHQGQNDDYHRRHRCANGYAQHLTVDLALCSIIAANARTHLGAGIIVRTSPATVTIGIRACVALSAGSLELIGPRVPKSRLAFTTETAPNVGAHGLRMTVIQLVRRTFIQVCNGHICGWNCLKQHC